MHQMLAFGIGFSFLASLLAVGSSLVTVGDAGGDDGSGASSSTLPLGCLKKCFRGMIFHCNNNVNLAKLH